MQEYEEVQSLVTTFYLADTLFGVDALNVQEIIPICSITPVHHAPTSISGIINLRGQIVTILNLAEKLEISAGEEDLARHIIIIHWRDENVGLLVHRVADVVPLEQNQLAPVPANIHPTQQQFMKGVSPSGSRLVAILDIQKVLDGD
jgi:purine-binding chemotaxis protein CheW